MYNKLRLLLILCFLLAFINACDVTESDRNMHFRPSSSLTIVGENVVTMSQDDSTPGVAVTSSSYYVKAYTIEKDYSWSVSEGAQIDSVYRQGGFMDVSFTEAGTYTISVEDSEAYQGTLEVTVNSAPD